VDEVALGQVYIRVLRLYPATTHSIEPGSSVSVVSGYGLDDRAIEVRSPAERKDFYSSVCVQTSSGAHPASCTVGTGGPFPGSKARPGRDADHSLHLVSRSRLSKSHTSSPHPLSASVACSGTVLAFNLSLQHFPTIVCHGCVRCEIALTLQHP
jgi:hypothetical protein